MNKTINEYLCDVENKEIIIDDFNFDDIEIVLNGNILCTGKFDDVYQFIYQQEYLDYDVVSVHVGKEMKTTIVISLDKNVFPIQLIRTIKFR